MSVKTIDRKILNELKSISRYAKETRKEVELAKYQAHQTKDSPYLSDRKYFSIEAIKGNPEETAWKKVPTYEENRGGWLQSDTTTVTQGDTTIHFSKKLNII